MPGRPLVATSRVRPASSYVRNRRHAQEASGNPRPPRSRQTMERPLRRREPDGGSSSISQPVKHTGLRGHAETRVCGCKPPPCGVQWAGNWRRYRSRIRSRRVQGSRADSQPGFSSLQRLAGRLTESTAVEFPVAGPFAPSWWSCPCAWQQGRSELVSKQKKGPAIL
jgi:hypothetical protein